MGKFGLFSFALLSLQALLAAGQSDATDSTEAAAEVATLAVSVSASFPASEIFGVKLVNGHPTQALLSISNDEPEPVFVNFVGGSLWSDDPTGEQPSQVVRNLTAIKYEVEIPAGQKEDLTYSFATEMHPQDLRLNIASVISDGKGRFFTIQAFNETVSIVEPDTSILDPQIIFLYFFILACFVGVVYFFYNIWIAPYFPQKRKGGDRSSKRSGQAKKTEVETTEAVESPSIASTTAYNSEWIPAHHLAKPESKKVKGGTSRSRTRA